MENIYSLKQKLEKYINLHKIEESEECIKSLESEIRAVKERFITYELLQIEAFIRDCENRLYKYKFPPLDKEETVEEIDNFPTFKFFCCLFI